MNKNNKEAYENKYKQGYGIVYPEGHIIRIYEHIIKDIIGNKRGNLLDFGCGTGTHLSYFHSKGFKVYGVDIINRALKQARNRLFIRKNYIKKILPDISNFPFKDKKFDVIFSNQSLYYLSNHHLDKLLKIFDSILTPDGIVVFTMVDIKNFYYKDSKYVGDGRYKVTDERLKETSYILFVYGVMDMKRIFERFKPLATGEYDFTLDGKSSLHRYFLGRKKD